MIRLKRKKLRFCCLAIALMAICAAASLTAAPKPPKKKTPSQSAVGFANGPDGEARFIIDDKSKRNEISFTSEAPKETIVGKTREVTGEIVLNPRAIDSIHGRVSLSWKSLDTGNRMRNQHMLTAPWVNSAEFPDIVFTMKKIQKLKTAGKSGKTLKGQLVGTMTMNGAEKELKVPVTLVYVSGESSAKPKKKTKKDEENGSQADKKEKSGIGLRTGFTIELADFDIKGRGVGQAVAEEQQIKVSLFFALEQDQTPDSGKGSSKRGKKK